MKIRTLLLFAAGLALTAGNLMADDKPAASTTPAAAPAGQAAAKPKSSNPTIAEIQAAIDLEDSGNTTAAVAAFEKIQTKSKNLEAWRLTDEANIYLNVGDNDKAISLLEQATTTNPKNYVSWNNLGTAYENTDQLDKAKDAYQKSIDAAKDAGASSAKAEGNLEALQARLDKQGAKEAKDNGGKPMATPMATPVKK
ncbi:MAG TPA: tetratricopeptide repeat protein [bacterium]|nr:tetratricopeptide repeat protein [bacterium]